MLKYVNYVQFIKITKYTIVMKINSSIQFSLSVLSSSLPSHGLHHASIPVHPQLPDLAQTHVH